MTIHIRFMGRPSVVSHHSPRAGRGSPRRRPAIRRPGAGLGGRATTPGEPSTARLRLSLGRWTRVARGRNRAAQLGPAHRAGAAIARVQQGADPPRPASRDMTAHPREALHRNVIRGCRGPRRDRQCHAHSPCHGVGTEVPRSRGGGSARGESARTDVAGTVTTRDRPPRSIRAHVTGWFPGSGAIRFHRIGSAPSRLPRGTRWSVAELITPLPLRGQRRHQTGFPIIRSDSVGPAPATMPW